MMHQIEQKLTIKAYPMNQHVNQTLQVAMKHFATIVYHKQFDAIDDTLEPHDIFHDAINTRKYSIELYQATYQLSKMKI